MKIFRNSVLLVGMLAIASAVQARSAVPIVDHSSVPVTTGSGKAADLETVKRAIINGGAAGARKWDIERSADGKTLKGTYRVRTHTVVVDIVPSPTSYSVKYSDSVNMKFEARNGAPLIHPYYNKWVDELIESIRFELKKL
jgi:hypothetical protein